MLVPSRGRTIRSITTTSKQLINLTTLSRYRTRFEQFTSRDIHIQQHSIVKQLVVRSFTSQAPRLSKRVLRVEQVSNPRLFVPASRVSDALGCLSQEQISHLDEIIDRMRNNSLAEIAVVTLESIELEPHQVIHAEHYIRQFAIDLFNHWQIGDRRRNDGVLLLIDKSARRIECVTGKSIDDDQWILDELITKTMVPALKAGRYDTAIINAVELMEKRSVEWQDHVLAHIQNQQDAEFQPIESVDRTERLDSTHAPRAKPSREEFFGKRSSRQNPFANFVRPLLAACAAMILFRVFFGSDDENRSNRRVRRPCPNCKNGQLKVIGVASSSNLRSEASDQNMNRRDTSSETQISGLFEQNTVSGDSLDSSVGLVDADRAVDFETMLNSLSADERSALRQGREFNCMACMDCSHLFVQERVPSLRPTDQLQQVHRRAQSPVFPTDHIIIPPLGPHVVGNEVPQRRPVTRLNPEPALVNVRGRDISSISVNSSPASSGFGGGSSRGSGGSGSF